MKKYFLIIGFLLTNLLLYAQIPLLGNIQPGAVADSYYLVEDIYIKGGYAVVPNLTARDKLTPAEATDTLWLPIERRKEGMLCYVVSEAKFYQLIGGVQNGNWIEIALNINLEYELRDFVWDTIRLINHDTKIWQLRLSGDTLYYNNQIFLAGGGTGGDLPLINVDRPINFITDATNIATVIGRNNLRLDSLVEMVFYAALPPGASLSGTGGPVFEYGSTNTVTLNWTATKTTNPITEITLDGSDIPPTGNTQSGTRTATIPTNTNKTYTLRVEESTGLFSTANKSYSFQNKVYVGIEADGPVPDDAWYDAITDTKIRTYTYGNLASAYPNTMFNISNPSGARIVVVAPTAFGQPKAWFDGSSPSLATPLVLVRTWNYTNQYGYVTEYKMWVTSNKQMANPLKFYLDEN